MTNMPSTESSDRAPLHDIVYAIRYYLGGRRALFILVVVLAAGGGILNWSWLVAAGLAPILIALLPCAAMCALGLCMQKHRGGGHAGFNNQQHGASTSPLAGQQPDSSRNFGKRSHHSHGCCG